MRETTQADSKASEEEEGGGALSTGLFIPLQAVVQAMVRLQLSPCSP